MTDYKAIFAGIEQTLIRVGAEEVGEDNLRRQLDQYRHLAGKTFSDEEYYQKLVFVVFYSGFRAATVTAKRDLIRHHFPSHTTVAAYSQEDLKRIAADPKMIRNLRKVQACFHNAATVSQIVSDYGSFQKYIDSFEPRDSFENLLLLKEDLEHRFDGLGPITAYHVLTDIGLPVIKPDRVLCRIFQRLGLIENENQLLKTVIQGRKFASATGHPIRYIDIIFVAYGQMETKEFGLMKGICLEENPNCSICGVTSICKYYAQNHA